MESVAALHAADELLGNFLSATSITWSRIYFRTSCRYQIEFVSPGNAWRRVNPIVRCPSFAVTDAVSALTITTDGDVEAGNPSPISSAFAVADTLIRSGW